MWFRRVALFLLLAPWLAGCPKPGYMAGILVHISPGPVDSLHAALLSLGGLEPHGSGGVTENCRDYLKRLASEPGYVVEVRECWGENKASETGWGYGVLLYSWHGRDPAIRVEIDGLAEQIGRLLQVRVGDAKVTRGAGPLAMPF